MRWLNSAIILKTMKKRDLLSLSLVIALFLILPSSAFAATSYVDNTLGGSCAGGSGTSYRVANRDCGGSDGTKAWTSLLSVLTSSHVSLGDTVLVRGGTYTENQINTAFGGSSGMVLVQNYNGETVNVQTGTVTNGAMFITQNLKFKGINWDNNNVAAGSSGKYLFGVYSTTAPVSFTFEDGAINGRSSGNNLAIFQPYGTQAHTITINRSTIQNAATVVYNNGTGSSNDIVNIYSSLLHDNGVIHFQNSTQGTTLTLLNNTITRFTFYAIHLRNTGSSVTAKNNIFDVGGASFGYTVWNLGVPFDSEALANHSKFDVVYNYYYSRESPLSISTWDNLITSGNVVPYMPSTNWFVDPSFTSYNSDYTLSASSKIAQRGNTTHPPDGTDITGAIFGTNDVGAYANPSKVALPTLDSSKVGWLGDSIMNGTGSTGGSNSSYSVFSAEVPNETVTNYGVGGLFSKDLFWTVDQSLWSGDKVLMLSIGINDLLTPRTSQTDTQISDMVKIILGKITDFGATPIWLGTESKSGSPPDNTDVNAVNSAVENYADANGIVHGSILTQMQNDPNWQTDYYASLSDNVHPNNAGHAIIGHLAGYLFYNPSYTISTDAVNSSGQVRIYSNGKYRYTEATSSVATIDFSATPSGGSFNSNDSSAWLDVSNITWNKSGNYSKEWTAAGQGATTTVFTVGDLVPYGYYTFSVNNVAKQTIQADSTGHLSYTYTGGWSTHTFDVNGAAASCSLGITSPILFGQTATLSWSSSNAVSASLDQGIGTVATSSGSTAVSPTSAGTHTYTLSVSGGDGATTTCSATLVVNSTGNGAPVGLISGSGISSGTNSIAVIPTVPTATSETVSSSPTAEPILGAGNASGSPAFVQNLSLRDSSLDVQKLQQYLNAHGALLAAAGSGSPGQETNYFGLLTYQALIKFQNAHMEDILAPVGLTQGSGYFGPSTRAYIAAHP